MSWWKKLFTKRVKSIDILVDTQEEKIEQHYDFKRLDYKNGSYYLNNKRPYKSDGMLKKETIDLVFDFAYEMSFGGKGEHRANRSGGTHSRKNGEIFTNTFQGKLSECAACNFFWKYDKSIYPDFKQYKLGKWDTVDLTVCGKEITVKSTKYYGDLLLLETKDWNEKGQYIPNINEEKSLYDCFMLVRMKPSCEDIMKSKRLLYSNKVSRETLYSILSSQKWEYNFAGYITLDEYKYIINNNYILPQKATLGGKTVMDAENYYIQSGDMHEMNSFEERYLNC